jgi:hypothetical protein
MAACAMSFFNETLFTSLAQARHLLALWLDDY